ncbi:MAG: RidA family protein [Planctomycetota bacterium]|jgi:enamine deaminase RidA (YjgF/YER057c/UK114 family)
MDGIEGKLKEMGLALPAAAKALAEYVPAKQVGDLVFVSGQVPIRDGEFVHRGKVGAELTEEQARECALQCALNALAAIKGVVGSLDRVAESVQLRGFVNSAPGFDRQPEVINAASELMVKLFGESGRHARAAVGTCSLPRNVPVELELIARVGR